MICSIRTNRPDTELIQTAFARGAKSELVHANYFIQTTKPYDEVSILGILRGSGECYKKALEKKIRMYYIDHAYLKKCKSYRRQDLHKYYFRISVNRHVCKLTGRTDYKRYNTIRHRVPVEPVKRSINAKQLIICPPSRFLTPFFNAHNWLGETIKKLQPLAYDKGLKIVVREKRINQRPEYIHWGRVYAIVAYNSNLLVKGIVKGIPVFGGSEHSVIQDEWGEIENPREPDRERILAELMDNQFTIEEIRNGKAYALLKDREYG